MPLTHSANITLTSTECVVYQLKFLNGGFRLIFRVPDYSELPAAIWLYACGSWRRARNIKVRRERPAVYRRP